LSAILAWIVVSAYALVVAGWWMRHVLISLTRPLDLYVRPVAPEHSALRVSIIVPARNERDRIAGCIATLLQQGAVVHEVIVVDDRSDDGTADCALSAAGGDPRVRVVRVDELPTGWAGKAHACQRGGEVARADWLLFADADCRFRPGGLAGAAEYAERHQADLLSLWLAADHRSFWEHMLIPLCGALILYWFPPLRANRQSSSLGYANGQFILVRRTAYREMSGHECSRATVIEDVPLARHAKRSGLRLRTALGPEVAAVRMYSNFREIYDGWARIFVGALQRRWKLLASIGSLLGGSLLPSLGAPLAAAYVIRFGWPAEKLHLTIVVLLGLHFAAVYSVSYRLWGLCHCPRRHLGLYPVSVVVVIAILIRAWWWMIARRPIIWRGTQTGSQEQS
jgi:glycosyltransferase involved in cell wall biosynthesis